MTFNHNGGPPLVDAPEDVDKNGWIALHRGIRDHWLVGFYHNVQPADPTRGSACHFVAFVDLIMECRYREGYVLNGGRKMKIEPGQVVGAVSWLAHRWNWTPKKVRWFLEKLQDDGMITRSSMGRNGELNGTQKGNDGGKHASIITVCNYSKYQINDRKQGQEARGKQEASTGQQYIVETKEQDSLIGREQVVKLSEPSSDVVKPTKRKRKTYEYTTEFEGFWDAYPDLGNSSKMKAFAAWVELTTAQRDEARTGLAHLRKLLSEKPDRECCHVATYINERRWEAYPKTNHGTNRAWWKDPAKVAAITLDRWREGIRLYANGKWPPEKLGPAPGHHECVVPMQLISELRLEEVYTSGGIKRIK